MEKENITFSIDFETVDAQGRGSKGAFEVVGLDYAATVYLQGRLLEIVSELHGIAQGKSVGK